MKFSISAKKNQQTSATVAILCIASGAAKAKTFSVLGKKTAELVSVLAQSACADEKKRLQTAVSTDGVPHRFAVWCIAANEGNGMREKAAAPLGAWLKAGDEKNITIYLDGLNKKDIAALLPVLMRTLGDTFYAYRAGKTRDQSTEPECIEFVSEYAADADIQAAFFGADTLVRAMNFARDLGNAPANFCTPEMLADEARTRAQKVGAKAKIHTSENIAKLGMNAFLSVARGSNTEPRFIELSYNGGKKSDAPIVLIGKGITFDSGGISLKSGEGMDEMKYDMCGAASVIAAFCAAAELKLPLNLVALVPTCENMPSGHANRPGDIVTSMNGLTIEILNTDAEGRLILCDALAYAERFKPQAVIDVATLTGACIIALGHIGSGVLGNNQNLIDELLSAAGAGNDKAWQLPLWEEYRDQLKSNFADLANIGGRPAGTITAASFLSHFTEKYPWAHLDIAGTAWRSGKDKGATGRPVPLLLAFLIHKAQQAVKGK